MNKLGNQLIGARGTAMPEFRVLPVYPDASPPSPPCLHLALVVENIHVHRRRSGWTSGGRMASAEGGSMPSGVGYEEGCPLSSLLRGLRERRELPQRGTVQSPGRKRILAYFEGPQNAHFCTYMTKSGRGDNLHQHPSATNSGGTCPPCPPVIYAHDNISMYRFARLHFVGF